jgi:hypothetical protein
MPQKTGEAYECAKGSKKVVTKAACAPKKEKTTLYDSKLFNILSDEDIRTKFDHSKWKKVFFTTTTQHAQNPKAKAAPKADVREAHCWAPKWSPERAKNAASATTTTESYKEINKDHIMKSVSWKHEDTIRVFFQPPEVTPSEYQHNYALFDKKCYTDRLKPLLSNEASQKPLDLSRDLDSHEHDCYNGFERKMHRPKPCVPFETEREMSRRTRHLGARHPKTTYQVLVNASPERKPNIRKVMGLLAAAGQPVYAPQIVTHKGT